MRLLFLFLLCMSFQAYAQRIALVDMQLKKPVTYSDNFGSKEIFKDLFPVYTNDQYNLVQALEQLARYIEKSYPEETITDTIYAGNTLLINNIEILHHKPFYSIRLKTTADEISIYVDLIEKGTNKRVTQLKLLKFADYLHKGTDFALNKPQ